MDISTVGILLSIITVLLLVYVLVKLSSDKGGVTKSEIENIEKAILKVESGLKDEISRNRTEQNSVAKDLREEITNNFKVFENNILNRITEISTMQKNQLEVFGGQLKDFKEETNKTFKLLEEVLVSKVNQISEYQKEQLSIFSVQLNELTKSTAESLNLNKETLISNIKTFEDSILKRILETGKTQTEKLDRIDDTVNNRLKELQNDNTKKLEEMRATVDEKLQSTLEKRLGDSFQQVSQRLEQVHQGLGEMKNLATGVGDLKKVLTNVKTRGTLGEVQLERILEMVLTREQYSKNVKPNPDTNHIVEFGIVLPGYENKIWIPIDAKFPVEDYTKLMDAYDNGSSQEIEASAKALRDRVLSCAKDIRDKYIIPPYTTDFAIMFLPTEGLYAEVLRSNMVEVLQLDYKVIVAGPTTFTAILNSLQVGFRTLAIEKRTSEIYDLLRAVKTEFGKFGTVLEKTKTKLKQATNEIENASTRTRVIEKKLKNMEELPAGDTQKLLGEYEMEEEEIIEVEEN